MRNKKQCNQNSMYKMDHLSLFKNQITVTITRLFFCMYALLSAFNVVAQCGPTSATLGSSPSSTGTLGTTAVTVTVSSPTVAGCLAYGFCYTYNLNGFRVDTGCTLPYQVANFWKLQSHS